MRRREISPLSLHDALPISSAKLRWRPRASITRRPPGSGGSGLGPQQPLIQLADLLQGRFALAVVRQPRADLWHLLRSEEHTSELQSLRHLVCRLLLEKKKQ